ncbi:hypothetical protein [Undibacterium parvum]|uniref:Uncharacterized protein n=1 Tax=Undibacterium parvum TaxID=401471 RepID=A0A3S9HP51_9BURK|nr:hypothetical protein [Undibacterium parvum]AZP13867.1 hypothetical protein EJN92_18840 [Undibacterium parvum]
MLISAVGLCMLSLLQDNYRYSSEREIDNKFILARKYLIFPKLKSEGAVSMRLSQAFAAGARMDIAHSTLKVCILILKLQLY